MIKDIKHKNDQRKNSKTLGRSPANTMRRSIQRKRVTLHP